MNFHARVSSDFRLSMLASLPFLFCLMTVFPSCSCAAQTGSQKNGENGTRGFVFLDGRYIAPPYVLDLNDDTLSINGYEFREEDLDLSAYQEYAGPNPMSSGEWAQQRAQYTALAGIHNLSRNSVYAGGVVVMFTNRKPMFLDEIRGGQQLINTLTQSKADRDAEYGIPKSLGSDLDRATWALLVSEFQTSPEFLTRGKAHIGNLERAQRANADVNARIVWKGRIEYPLTAFAMVMVALAFGHLQTTKPYVTAETALVTDSPSPQQTVFRSLLLVGMLSVVDLIWTVVASDSGSMRELNPFGRQLIDRPLQLVAFKSATTSLAIGLLLWLHRTPIAQAASWWSCLVLTLVTARWLMFSSLFL